MTRLRQAIERHFFPLLFFYLAAKVALRVWVSPALAWDEAEAVLQSQHLAIGYGAQPPLFMWLQTFVFTLVGESVLGVALLKSMLIFGVYAGVYGAARTAGAERATAVWAAMSLLAIPLFAYEAHRDLSHSLAAATFSVLCIAIAMRVALGRRVGSVDYAALGLAVGLSLLTKYNLVLVVAALGLAGLTMAPVRPRILDPRMVLAAAVALSVIAPHYLWVAAHWDIAVHGNVDKLAAGSVWTPAGAMTGLAELAESLAGFVALLVIVTFGWLRPAPPSPGDTSAARPGLTLVARHLGGITAILIVLVMVTGATNFKDRWLLPLYIVLPMLVVVRRYHDGISARRRNGFAVTLVVLGVLQTALLVVPVMRPDLKGKPGRLNIPVEAVAAQVAARGFTAGNILTDQHSLGASLRLANRRYVVIVPRLMPVNASRVAGDGDLMILWRADAPEMPEALAETAASLGYSLDCPARAEGMIEAPYRHWRGEPFAARYLVVPAVCRDPG